MKILICTREVQAFVLADSRMLPDLCIKNKLRRTFTVDLKYVDHKAVNLVSIDS